MMQRLGAAVVTIVLLVLVAPAGLATAEYEPTAYGYDCTELVYDDVAISSTVLCAASHQVDSGSQLSDEPGTPSSPPAASGETRLRQTADFVAPRPAAAQPVGGNGVVLRDGAGATPAEIAASQGGPTAGANVTTSIRNDSIAASTDAAGNFSGTCWRCGETSVDPADFHVGHRNVPRADGGNLSPQNLCWKEQPCNLSAGNRDGPSPGMSCAERGGCRPWN